MTLTDRLKNTWNAFLGRDPTMNAYAGKLGLASYTRPDRVPFNRTVDKSIISSIYNRLAIDCAAIDIKHVKVDDKGNYIEDMDSDLNNCLTVEANIDQTGRAMIQDAILTMFDEGSVAIVPTDTDVSLSNDSFDIVTLRCGKIIEWHPLYVKVNLYNERSGKREDIMLPKKSVAIVENPFYTVMNRPNSTSQRLMRKLSLLDVTDEKNSSGKLDMIIQFPYQVRTDNQINKAKQRVENIEAQLSNSNYGVAYADATEKITQLNRPLENQLQAEVEYLTKLLFSQLGLTQEILDGTANKETMQNYQSRTIEPILTALVEEMRRKFLTKTARTRGQSIKFFTNPFRLVPVSDVAEMADKFTRNEILTSNEFRQIIGMKPSEDPTANALINKNISMSPEQQLYDIDGNPINNPMQQPGMEGEQAQGEVPQEGAEGTSSEFESGYRQGFEEGYEEGLTDSNKKDEETKT